jgi:hypothetical protein
MQQRCKWFEIGGILVGCLTRYMLQSCSAVPIPTRFGTDLALLNPFREEALLERNRFLN